MSLYDTLLRPLLFRLDAETAHHFTLDRLAQLPLPLVRNFIGVQATKPTQAFGLNFRNPVGLAAGLDKNAVALPAWEALGFGFVEVGTVTALPQPGNPLPRLFRYPEQQALVNRMGFNNEGAEAMAERLRNLRESGRWPKIPVGINLGKSKVTPLEEAAGDYQRSMLLLQSFGDYFVINVSSPNTQGLRDLQGVEALREIIRAVKSVGAKKPLLVKIAPDLTEEQAVDIAKLADYEGLSGLIATNTTLDHSSLPPGKDETGGLSGAPLRQKSNEILATLRQHTTLPIIGSGGVMNGEAAKEKFDAGASLVQIYTGFVYRGPQLIREITDALA